jgi:hypothetical protein
VVFPADGSDFDGSERRIEPKVLTWKSGFQSSGPSPILGLQRPE